MNCPTCGADLEGETRHTVKVHIAGADASEYEVLCFVTCDECEMSVEV